MDHAPGMGIGHCVADVDEPPEQPPQRQGALTGPAAGVLIVPVEASDGLLEGLAADQPHGVERPALRVSVQTIDRHDARVFQPAGQLGLQQKTGTAAGIIGLLGPDLLERDLAMQLAIQGDRDQADASLRERPDHAEPPPTGRASHAPVGRHRCNFVHGSLLAVAQGEPVEGQIEHRVGQPPQAGGDRLQPRDGGQAPFGVVTVFFQVPPEQ